MGFSVFKRRVMFEYGAVVKLRVKHIELRSLKFLINAGHLLVSAYGIRSYSRRYKIKEKLDLHLVSANGLRCCVMGYLR